MGKMVLNGYSSTCVSLWDSLMFGRVLEYMLVLVLVQVYLAFFKLPSGVHGSSVPMMLFLARPVLRSWVKPCGMRLEIRKGGKKAPYAYPRSQYCPQDLLPAHDALPGASSQPGRT